MRWLLAFAAFNCSLLTSGVPTSAAAPQAARVKVLVWIETSDDRALVERVRGQVSDLDLDLQLVEAGVGGNRAAPADSPAFARVWFVRDDPSADRVVVHVTQGDKGRVLEREIGDGLATPNGSLSSATLEGAALIVREALRDLASSEPPSAPPPKPQTATKAVDPVLAAPGQPAHVRIYFRSELTWEEVLDGAGPLRRQGPGVRLGIEYRTLELSAFGATSLPVTERDAYGAIRLRRHILGLRIGRQWPLSKPITLSVGFLAGTALYARSAQQLQTFVSPTSDHVTVSALFGPESRLGWAPASGPLEFALTAGLDVVPGAPRIGYRVGDRFQPSFAVWRLQPSFGLGVRFLSDRLP